ncbi:sensor histidine kinase [Vibrio salinus]|uniref:sensor histidine kinase n=1 Tax=Vibrio salinus TaxID=2899784 RepID=UPI001E4B0C42|nr:HAMP domain-containing sensor histidine kinase [Vibrio salinus]MCE0496148.1 HAMP domain-containing histidine kinase [Vibrio salinus]
MSVWIKTDRNGKGNQQTWYESYSFPLALMVCSVSLLMSPYTLSEKLYLLGSAGFLLVVVYQKLRLYSEESKQMASDTLQYQLHEVHLRELGEWSAALAHEMKTPLSSALLSSDMIVRLAKDDELILDHAVRMKKSIQRVIGTCQSVLNYSQTLTPDKSEFLINDSIEEALSLLHFRLKNFSVSRKIQPDLTVFGDKNLLLSVWSNLLSNAIDACEESEVKYIAIEAFASQGLIHIKIMDEGEGISVNNKALIEDAFFTTKHGNNGTGVGLNVVSNILKSHRGSLHFDDKSVGACAHVVIPENIQ